MKQRWNNKQKAQVAGYQAAGRTDAHGQAPVVPMSHRLSAPGLLRPDGGLLPGLPPRLGGVAGGRRWRWSDYAIFRQL
jgi:hypothetical protein